MGERELRIKIMDQYKRKSETDMLILVPILDNQGKTVGFLRPVTADYKVSIPNCVSLFSNWRKENPAISAARFEITDERTDTWLQKLIIHNDNRILFMVQDVSGKNIGHIGFAGFRDDIATAEVDSVLKGVKTGYPRFMEFAMYALLKWGREVMALKNFDLEVLWNNTHAIAFYERCGFVKDYLIPLERIELPDETKWVVNESLKDTAELYYQHMSFQGE